MTPPGASDPTSQGAAKDAAKGAKPKRPFWKRFWQEVRNDLVTGVVVLAPIGITVWIVRVVIGWMDNWVNWVPRALQPDQLLGFRIPGLEALLLVLTIFVVGFLARSYFVKKALGFGESLVNRIPFVSKVHGATKQVFETLFRRDGMQFRKVVLIEYPRKGAYALAFQTGVPRGEVQSKTVQKVVCVFMPSTPNPTTGFLMMYPREDVIELEMPVETAFRIIMSGGILDSADIEEGVTEADVDKLRRLKASGE